MRVTFSAAAIAAVILLAGCGGGEAARTEVSAAPPPSAAPAPSPPAAGNGSPAAPGVTVPPDRPVVEREGDIAVPGGRETPLPQTPADTRTTSQRMADIRAWDDCVTRAQDAAEANPNRVQLNSPEEICSQRLGMAGRTAVPESRRRP